MNTNSYKDISNFGPQVAKSNTNNPLTYCIGNNMQQRFLHGGHSDIYGQNSKPCQLFMSQYCSEKWDGFCELASKNSNKNYPDQAEGCLSGGLVACKALNAGETLIHNTAARKYLVKMHNAQKKYEPFDPLVASSPMISYWVGNNSCMSNTGIPEYSVDPKEIDQDIVMDKILQNPIIAMNILINIYNTMKRYKTLSKLKGTKIGKFYQTHPYFKSLGGL